VVGFPATIRSAWDNARRGGTVVVVGAGRGRRDGLVQRAGVVPARQAVARLVLRRGERARDYAGLLQLWRAGRLDLDGMISKRLRLHEINDAIEALRDPGTIIRQIVSFE
jgi:S-(hydroxymethyl)glutathione dehydrogenase/alcohol dehydrogenase